jgi:hypothetical protein
VNLDNYMDVATRLRYAYARFPDLRIIESRPVLIDAGPAQFIEIKVTIHRTVDDVAPVVAYCWEEFPGKSAFTRGSEQPNASTSAVGRALRWMLPDISGPVASQDEVRNRTDDRSGGAGTSREAGARAPLYVEPDPAGEIERPVTRKLASDPQKKLIRRLCGEKGYTYEGDLDHLGMGDAIELIDVLKAMDEIR